MSEISIEESNRRLLLLADFLEKLPPERFNYGEWVGKDWGGKQDLSCGTTACALGWACTMPEFQALGLKFRSDEYRPGPEPSVAGMNVRNTIMCLFGDRNGVVSLFFPRIAYRNAYPSTSKPAKVAARFRKFVSAKSLKSKTKE
jgi:hypothetical protein